MRAERSSWATAIGFSTLLLLGLGIPFWMEYKSLTRPLFVRRKDVEGRIVIDQGKKYYCPACGAELTLPSWGGAPAGRVSTLTLTSSTTSSLDLLRAQRRRAEISGEAP